MGRLVAGSAGDGTRGGGTEAELARRVYQFIKEELPDYVYAGLEVRLTDPVSGRQFTLDLLLIIPHIGVFIMEIKAVESNISPSHLHQLSKYREAVCNHLRDKFLVTPFVYEMLCLPSFKQSDLITDGLADVIDPNFIFFEEDFANSFAFMSKLLRGKFNNEKLYQEKGVYDDISDFMAHNIYFYWQTGILKPERPDRPPLIFLSFNRNNHSFSAEIKSDFESRGIFVWRAPEDVPISEYYKDVETEAILNCDAFVILISTPSLASCEVRYEYEKAKEYNKRIIPILIEDRALDDIFGDDPDTYQILKMTKLDNTIMDGIEQKIKEQ